MNQEIQYLKNNQQLSDVIAEGFAQIYHLKPQFPVTFLAQYLKNHNELQHQKKQLIRKLINNQTIRGQIKREEEAKQKQKAKEEEDAKRKKEKLQAFEFRIKQCSNHEEFLNQYCEWIQQEKQLTGVYIAELEHQFKAIDLLKEDSEEAHIDSENPKVLKFKAASHSHHSLMIGKSLSQESVIGKLLNEKPEEGGQQQEGKKQNKPKGQIYIPFVQQNKDLHFFKYPRLGSFFAVVMKIKSYLHQKIFDANIVKFQTYKKAKEEYQKEQEEREAKFRQLYDQRSSQGADEKQLEELQQKFEQQEQNFPKPILEEYQFVQRDFVVCFDTLGRDREISENDKAYCRFLVDFLRESWESKEKQLLQKDIESQLKQNADNIETPLHEVLTRLIEDEEKELGSHEQVQKVKANQKLMELELNTLRMQKIKEYIEEEKNIAFLQTLLDRRVIKYPEIMKIFLIFAGHSKQELNFSNTNIFNWLKAKTLINKETIHSIISQYVPRGAKPSAKVQPYAKWQRIMKCLEKYDQNTVASYNLFLAFILRFLQLAAKVRIADNEARRTIAKADREAREQKIKQAQAKALEKQQKLNAAKAEAEGKEEAFDQEGWVKIYEEQNPPIEIGDEIVEEKDEDLEEESAEPPAQ